MAGAVKVGSFGGSGGKPFETEHAHRVQNFQIRHGAAIDAVAINVRPDDATAELQREEYLTGITAYVGPLGGFTVVRSLSLESNLGTYGPYGPEIGTPFSVPVVDGKIVGFFGRSSGLHVDAIGVYIAPNK